MALSMMQEMALYDADGKCRCPRCGKYTKREDFPDQPAAANFKSSKMIVHVHLEPMCNRCWMKQ